MYNIYARQATFVKCPKNRYIVIVLELTVIDIVNRCGITRLSRLELELLGLGPVLKFFFFLTPQKKRKL
jgi:hypothetical protein